MGDKAAGRENRSETGEGLSHQTLYEGGLEPEGVDGLQKLRMSPKPQ